MIPETGVLEAGELDLEGMNRNGTFQNVTNQCETDPCQNEMNQDLNRKDQKMMDGRRSASVRLGPEFQHISGSFDKSDSSRIFKFVGSSME
jgi:hypothetical protein